MNGVSKEKRARCTNGNALFNIAILLPNDNEYWVAQNLSIASTAVQYEILGVHLNFFTYDRKDKVSFYYQTQEALFSCPDGIILAPLIKDEMLRFTRELDLLNIPYAFVHADLEDTHPLTVIGQDQENAGHLAAKILNEGSLHGHKTFIVRFDDELERCEARVLGLRRYYEEYRVGDNQIQEVRLPEDMNDFLQWLDAQAMQNAVHFFVPGSQSYRLANVLKNHQGQFKIVGFDLNSENEKHLKSGTIDYIIDQDPKKQGQLAVISLCERLIMNKEVPNAQRIDPSVYSGKNHMAQLNLSDH